MPSLSLRVTDAERIREHIEASRNEGESWTRAVERFAKEMRREPATIWRWLNGTSRVPAHILRHLFPPD